MNMGIKLADRRKPGPNGFMYHEKRTGWKSWVVDPISQWDFALLCRRYQEHAKANPGLALETDMARIELMMDFANAARYAQMAGAESYFTRTSEALPKTMAPQQARQRPGALASVVGRARNVAAGQKTLAEWWGKGGKPVDQTTANDRAAVCVKCPQNGSGGLLAKFTVAAAANIQESIEELNDLKMKTRYDDALGVCDACDCPLRLKVWTPLEHIVNNMPIQTKEKLDPSCWIL